MGATPGKPWFRVDVGIRPSCFHDTVLLRAPLCGALKGQSVCSTMLGLACMMRLLVLWLAHVLGVYFMVLDVANSGAVGTALEMDEPCLNL